MILSPTLDHITVLETRTFPSPSVIAGGKKRHVWITTATWIHTWITTATWSFSPWLQPTERASLLCSPTHFLFYFPFLSFPSSASQCSCAVTWHTYRQIHTHTHRHTPARHSFWRSNKAGENLSSLLRRQILKPFCCFVTRLLFLAAGAHSRVAEIDSLSKWHDTQLTTLSTAQPDWTAFFIQRLFDIARSTDVSASQERAVYFVSDTLSEKWLSNSIKLPLIILCSIHLVIKASC